MSEKKIENPFKYGKETRLHNIFDELMRLRDEVEATRQHAAAVAGFSDKLEFKSLRSVSLEGLDFYVLRSKAKGPYGTYDLNRLEVLLGELKAKKEAEIQEVEDYNLPRVKHNQQIFESIKKVMESLGIGATYSTYDYPSKRSRTKRTINHTSGWYMDLARVMPKSNVEIARRTIKALENSIGEFIKTQKELDRKSHEEREQKEMNELVMKFPDIFSTLKEVCSDVDLAARIKDRKGASVTKIVRNAVNDCLEKVLAQNKYLHLAHQLEANRNDWTDGCSQAEYGLNRFTVKTEEDREIESELRGLIINWDGDGRCFRDCKHNYDYLFKKVEDERLLKQYFQLKEYQDI